MPSAATNDVSVHFLPRLVDELPSYVESTTRDMMVYRVALRPPKKRATINRTAQLLVTVGWEFVRRPGEKVYDHRLILLPDLAETFKVRYNYMTAYVHFHPEDLPALLVAIDDAMERVM